MSRHLTLTKRYLLLIAAVMAIFITATLFITTKVMKSGMTRLFEQQVDRAKSVLAQYESGHALARTKEMDAVLSSPRFIAAVETGDSTTISLEAPVYQDILGADILALLDRDKNVTYLSGLPVNDVSSLRRLPSNDAPSTAPISFIAINDRIYEFVIEGI